MNFFDKAKEKFSNITKNIGEETIRVIDVSDEKEKREKETPVRTKPEKKIPEKTHEKRTIGLGIFDKTDKPKPAPTPVKEIKKPEKELKKPVEKKIVKEKAPIPDTSFEIEEEEDFFDRQKEAFQENQKKYENVPVPMVDGNAIQDVLNLLGIPATFAIENDVYLPDDLKTVTFDIEVPKGYDMGQVDTFISRVKMSIEKLVQLLTLRNEHIAKLATVVDRLQVDANNAKFNAEVANGINIMPTAETEEMENEIMKLKMLVKRLEEQLSKKHIDDSESTSENIGKFDELQDQLSIKDHKIEELEDEIYDLKNQLAILVEASDYAESQTSDNDDDNLFDFPGNDDDNDDDEQLPALENVEQEDEEEVQLPSFDEDDEDDPIAHMMDDEKDVRAQENKENPHNNSVFFQDEEEDLEDFIDSNSEFFAGPSDESRIELLDDNGELVSDTNMGTFYEEDDSELNNFKRRVN